MFSLTSSQLVDSFNRGSSLLVLRTSLVMGQGCTRQLVRCCPTSHPSCFGLALYLDPWTRAPPGPRLAGAFQPNTLRTSPRDQSCPMSTVARLSQHSDSRMQRSIQSQISACSLRIRLLPRIAHVSWRFCCTRLRRMTFAVTHVDASQVVTALLRRTPA